MENKVIIGYAVRKLNNGKYVGAHSLATKFGSDKLKYSSVSVNTYKKTDPATESNRAILDAIKTLKSSKHSDELNLIIGSNNDAIQGGSLGKQAKKAVDSLSKSYYLQMNPKLDKTLASVNKLNDASINKYIDGLKRDKAKRAEEAKAAREAKAKQDQAKHIQANAKKQLESSGKLSNNLDHIASTLTNAVKAVKAQSSLAKDIQKFGKIVKSAPADSKNANDSALKAEPAKSSDETAHIIRHLTDLPRGVKISRTDIKRWLIEDTHSSKVSDDAIDGYMKYLSDLGYISKSHSKYHKVYLQIRHGWFR